MNFLANRALRIISTAAWACFSAAQRLLALAEKPAAHLRLEKLAALLLIRSYGAATAHWNFRAIVEHPRFVEEAPGLFFHLDPPDATEPTDTSA